MLVIGALGCEDAAQSNAKVARVDKAAGVTSSTAERAKKARRSFCEAGAESDEVQYVSPTERQMPISDSPQSKKSGWRWVNLWATWCTPCVDEFPLLAQWQKTMTKDDMPISLELWSVDEDEARLKEFVAKTPPPGRLHWMAEGALPNLLGAWGLAEDTAIPVHVLVNPKDEVRCVRVGAVHASDYGTVRTIVRGG